MSVLCLCFHKSVHGNALSLILSSSKRRFCGRMEGALLEWNYHIIYWFTISLGDASMRVDNRQNIAAGSLYRYLCNTRIEFEAVDT